MEKLATLNKNQKSLFFTVSTVQKLLHLPVVKLFLNITSTGREVPGFEVWVVRIQTWGAQSTRTC